MTPTRRSWATSGAVKVERAKEHVTEFVTAFDAFRETDPYDITLDQDPQTGQLIGHLVERTPLPLRLSAIAADAVHNCRSALDTLWHHVYGAGRGEYFPILDSAELFERRFRRPQKAARQRAVDIIKEAKPYKGGNDLLYAIHATDCENKHGTLTLLACGLANVTLDLTATLPPTYTIVQPATVVAHPAIYEIPLPRGIQDGAELFSMAPVSEYVHMNYEFSIDVAFAEGEIVKSQPVIATLRQFTDIVEGLVQAFIDAGLIT